MPYCSKELENVIKNRTGVPLALTVIGKLLIPGEEGVAFQFGMDYMRGLDGPSLEQGSGEGFNY